MLIKYFIFFHFIYGTTEIALRTRCGKFRGCPSDFDHIVQFHVFLEVNIIYSNMLTVAPPMQGCNGD